MPRRSCCLNPNVRQWLGDALQEPPVAPALCRPQRDGFHRTLRGGFVAGLRLLTFSIWGDAIDENRPAQGRRRQGEVSGRNEEAREALGKAASCSFFLV